MFPFNFNSPQCQPQLQKTEVLRWLHSNHQFAYPFLSSMTPGTLAFMLENYREDVLNVTVSIFLKKFLLHSGKKKLGLGLSLGWITY